MNIIWRLKFNNAGKIITCADARARTVAIGKETPSVSNDLWVAILLYILTVSQVRESHFDTHFLYNYFHIILIVREPVSS